MRVLTSILTSVVLLILAAPLGYAQTPDGQTPFNEGVCDELIGHTPGLYGLCVAFCEAQDFADISVPITEQDLEKIMAAIPSGKIVENYNKRKKATDPPMPCIRVEEPCPCWDAAEFDHVTYEKFAECVLINKYGKYDEFGADFRSYAYPHEGYVFAHRYEEIPGTETCRYVDRDKKIFRALSITREEEMACEEQIRLRIKELGVTGLCKAYP